jgi:hypothetical protein
MVVNKIKRTVLRPDLVRFRRLGVVTWSAEYLKLMWPAIIVPRSYEPERRIERPAYWA